MVAPRTGGKATGERSEQEVNRGAIEVGNLSRPKPARSGGRGRLESCQLTTGCLRRPIIEPPVAPPANDKGAGAFALAP